MNDFRASFDVYSPRWGHPDRYSICFNQDGIFVKQGAFTATCRPDNDGELVWSEAHSRSENPLLSIFSNDAIYAPGIVPKALEWAWEQWRDGAVNADVLRAGLEELFVWIDQTARGKPKGELWQGMF